MKRFLLFFMCLWATTAVFGQYTSRLGRFQVDNVKGCAPFTVTITDTNLITSGLCTGLSPCTMSDGAGFSDTNHFTFTYTTPGTFKLSVNYQSLMPGIDDITITVVENKDPTFEVFSCLNNEVTVKVVDKSFDMYLIDFDNAGPPVVYDTIPSGNNATQLHNYVTPGSYTISVRGKNVGAADNCKNLTEVYQTITTMPGATMNTMTALDINSLALTMTTAKQVEYKLEVAVNNGGTFQSFEELYETNADTVTNLLVDNNFYCFRLNSFDPCSGQSSYSNQICSQDFDVAFLNGDNQLNWRTETFGIKDMSINRNDVIGYTTHSPVSPFDDKDYDCNTQYCYQIVSEYFDGSKSTSLIKCGTGILTTTYPAIDNVTSIVRVGAELSWTIAPTIKVSEFDILKSMFHQPLTQFDQSKVPTYTDGTYDYNGGTCYEVVYSDKCNNHSLPGIVACPMALAGSLDDSNAVTLTWNSYTGYNQGVSTYQVNKYTKDDVLIGSFSTTDTTFIDYDPADNNQVVRYAITAFATEPGILRSISNNITITKPVRLILPTAFTPNGDGINPGFTVSGKFVSKMTLQIFDRWGVMVFSSEKNEPWDGTKAGKPLPESAYVWKAEVVDTAGNIFTKEGTVLLLRPRR